MDETINRLYAIKATNDTERNAVALTVDLLRREGLEAFNGKGASLAERDAQITALVEAATATREKIDRHLDNNGMWMNDARHAEWSDLCNRLKAALAPFEQE